MKKKIWIPIVIVLIAVLFIPIPSGVYKDDNWIDICGYAALGAEIQSDASKTEFGKMYSETIAAMKKYANNEKE